VEGKVSLSSSQESATGPYPDPDASSSHLPTSPTFISPKIHSYIFPSSPRSSTLSLSFRFIDEIFYKFLISFMRAACSTYLILLD
jgi:hypothetical protein